MQPVRVYSKTYCPFCDRAKALFKSKGVEFTEILLDDKPEDYARLKEQTGHMTVPQIFIGGHFVGGFKELSQLNENGELDQLLKS
jgi:glutaredoxin 3